MALPAVILGLGRGLVARVGTSTSGMFGDALAQVSKGAFNRLDLPVIGLRPVDFAA